VLAEENLIADSDPDQTAFREFVTFALEVQSFAPGDWDTYFPGISPDAPPLSGARKLINADALRDRTRPPALDPAPGPTPPGEPENGVPVPVRLDLTPAGRRRIAAWQAQGNDLGGAILLHQVGDAESRACTARLLDRLRALLDLTPDQTARWGEALGDLLPRAAVGDWSAERRLLYELQAACLAVERPTYAANFVGWAATLGRRPLKRPLATSGPRPGTPSGSRPARTSRG
jgi:hypothetical protein